MAPSIAVCLSIIFLGSSLRDVSSRRDPSNGLAHHPPLLLPLHMNANETAIDSQHDVKAFLAHYFLTESTARNGGPMEPLFVRWHKGETPPDWTTYLLFRLCSVTLFFIFIFAAVLHRKLPNAPSVSGTPARDGAPYATILLPIVIITAFALGAAYPTPEVRERVKAQLPLVFMLLGFGLAQMDVPAKWSATFAPLTGCYALIICLLSSSSAGLSLHSARGVLRVIVPLDVMAEQKSGLVGDLAASYGAALLCIFLLPALQRLVQHYASRRVSVASMVFVVWVMALVGIKIDLGLYMMKWFSPITYIFSSIAARSQLPSFTAGIIVAYCPPTRNVPTMFTGLMFAAAYVFLNMQRPDPVSFFGGSLFPYMAARGFMLPMQAGMLWALDGGLPRVSWLPPMSFAPIFLLPLSSTFVLTELFDFGDSPFRWVAVVALVLVTWSASFAVEIVSTKIGSILEATEEDASLTDSSGIEHAPYLGEHTEPGYYNGLRAFGLGVIYYLTLLSCVLTMCFFFWDSRASITFLSEGRTLMYDMSSWAFMLVFGLLLAPWFSLNTIAHLRWSPPSRKPVPRTPELVAAATQLGQDHMQLTFRYVTRGNSPTLMAANVEQSLAVLGRSGLPKNKWRLEVVTDNAMNLQSKVSGPIFETVVPETYKCPNGGLYKARALHWAVGNSEPRPKRTDWIIHLDEETLFDTHTVCALYEYCIKENVKVAMGEEKQPSMGQGVIIYNCYAQGIENHFTAMTDSTRVADDFGMFQLSYKVFQRSMIGMHGSFIACAQSVEEDIGFDHGVEGSITEDTYFSMVAGDRLGVKMAWIDAFMYEQSPFTITDLIRQRARWFHGLWYCAFTKNITSQRSLLLKYMVISWAVCWMCFVSWPLRANDIISPNVENMLVFPRTLWLWRFILGFVLSYSPYREGWPMWCLLFLLQTLMILPSIVAEVGGVLYGAYLVFTKNVSFFIVQKEKQGDAPTKPSAKFATKPKLRNDDIKKTRKDSTQIKALIVEEDPEKNLAY